MAKIKFGMMMTDARGKLGGHVFSKNRAGAYVRTKVSPVNPRTDAQQFSRSVLGTLSIGWNALTDEQRASWNGGVENWQGTDIFGDIKKPTGKNLFVGLNKNLLGTGQSQIAIVPEKIEIPVILGAKATFDNTASNLVLSLNAVPAGVVLQVWATAPQNAGVSFVKNRLRVISVIPSGEVSATALYDAYVDKFGAVPDVANISVQLRYIGSNGQAGVPTIVKAVVIP